MVAEPIGRPYTAVAIRAVDGVDKPKALGLLCMLAVIVGVAEQTGGHAWPEGEDDKGQKVAHRHGPSPLLVEIRAEVASKRPPWPRSSLLRLDPVSRPGRGQVKEDDEV